MRIFVINLARSVARREALTRRLNEAGLSATWIEGVDGQALERSQLQLGRGAHAMSNTEIGCYLSHVKAWRALRDSQASFGLILEDDVALGQDLPYVLSLLARLNVALDVIRLGATMPVRGKPLTKLPTGQDMVLPVKNVSGCMGYVVSAQGARRLLSMLSIPEMPVDDALDRYWQHGLRVVALRPSVIHHTEGMSNIEHTKRGTNFNSIGSRWRYSCIRRLKIARLWHTLRSETTFFSE